MFILVNIFWKPRVRHDFSQRFSVQSDDGHPVLNIYQEITAVAAAAVAGGHFSVESAQTADGLREEGFYEILWYHIHLEIAEVYMRLI